MARHYEVKFHNGVQWVVPDIVQYAQLEDHEVGVFSSHTEKLTGMVVLLDIYSGSAKFKRSAVSWTPELNKHIKLFEKVEITR